VANHADQDTLLALSYGREEKIGRGGTVSNNGERNLFTMGKVVKGKL
jgi:hypothetical protein